MVALANTLVRNPVHITVTPEHPTVDRISQRVLFVDKENKAPLLVHILRDPSVSKVIVFTQMKHQANKVVQHLSKSGISAVAIHGNKSQTARLQALAGFKANTVRVLAATDIAARGLDIDGVSHVVNFDLPNVVRARLAPSRLSRRTQPHVIDLLSAARDLRSSYRSHRPCWCRRRLDLFLRSGGARILARH